MAELLCPNCGKSNPDSLDFCQFCQTPLKPDAVLRIGDRPTKKNTGELESVLPDWLKDVRQQARSSAEEDAAQAAALSKAQKNEPPDLLAGLASQASSSDDEDVPDWLTNLNPAAKARPAATPTGAPETDFFAQFTSSKSRPTEEPPPEQTVSQPGAAAGQPPVSEQKDELSEWFTQTAQQPDETFEFEPGAERHVDTGWMNSLDSSSTGSPQKPAPQAPQEQEDLSWLHNLEEAAKQTGDLKAPKLATDWAASFEKPATPSQPSAPQEDLSWLDRLGGIEETPQAPLEQTSAPQDDLSWLDQLGAAQASRPVDGEETSSASQDDLSWLNKSGAVPEPQGLEAAPETPSAQPSFGEDLSWLNNLGGASEPLSTSPFSESESVRGTPRQTAPLGNKEDREEMEPDWLKSATQAPSMPPPGDLSMDWFTQASQPAAEKPAPPEGKTPAPFADLFSTPSEPSTPASQDVDSLFSMEMPDWLSRPEPEAPQPASSEVAGPQAGGEDSLAPVDLPSWVQAMRPVEAVISETAPSTEDQPEEKEGPLAGLRGVIPGAPVGSSRRPRSISLKLQANDEQQAGAALLEQILGSEASPRALIASTFVASQQVLRWVLTGLFLLVLSAVILLRSQAMPISNTSPTDGISNAVASIPAGAKVLVIIDYEPALAGEMEAIAEPLLDQIAGLSHPSLSFISTSPNGSALVERLMTNTINRSTPQASGGLGYQAGAQYFNLGYLPGGSAGVLGFLEGPGEIIPAAGVQSFADYAALIVMTDHAESGRVWVEQLQSRKQVDPALASKPLLLISSAQAGPLLQPYVVSGQINGMLSGLSDAARYQYKNNLSSGMARSYWDAFGVGLVMAIALIIVGSLWGLFVGMRARRSEAEQG